MSSRRTRQKIPYNWNWNRY